MIIPAGVQTLQEDNGGFPSPPSKQWWDNESLKNVSYETFLLTHFQKIALFQKNLP